VLDTIPAAEKVGDVEDEIGRTPVYVTQIIMQVLRP
jgi:hypothetical protein